VIGARADGQDARETAGPRPAGSATTVMNGRFIVGMALTVLAERCRAGGVGMRQRRVTLLDRSQAGVQSGSAERNGTSAGPSPEDLASS